MCPRTIRPLLIVALASGSMGVAVPTASWRVIAWNNLGMHCMDADFSVFAILPPYNVVHAQVIDSAGRLVGDPADVSVTYEAVADPSGSVNSTSLGKTNFWQRVAQLFGASPPPDTGLAGSAMPGTANVPQPMALDAPRKLFVADGIPITPWDDTHAKNPYPMLRIVARDGNGAALASTNVVVPVSDEMDCRTCHASGSVAAARPAAGWINDCDFDRDYKLNILRLHDERQAGDPEYQNALTLAGYDAAGLFATATTGGVSVLCARCHASNALPGTGFAGIQPLTQAQHAHHAGVTDPVTGQTLDADTNRSACYRCHPGSETRCLRGAMGASVASDGSLAIQCQDCHGSMSRVGAGSRQGWLEEPVCQSCHTGTATSNNGQIRYTNAFADGQPRIGVNPTFATNPDTPAPGVSLYRFSKGHGDLQCEACHGSTHAEYPSVHPNDNLQSLNLQGHVGALVDCAACHGANPVTVNGGPHGLHPIGQAWIDAHGDLLEGGGAIVSDCAACHGTNYRGTVLSRSGGERTFATPFGTKHFWRGFSVGCYDCHLGPSEGDGNPNHAPAASDATAQTSAYTPVSVPLLASDIDGDTLSYRIVTQPAGATAALSGSTATVHPLPGFVGSDSFSFAAWDGSTWSNEASVVFGVGGSFADVPVSSIFASSIERIHHSEITSGCGTSPLLYCPGSDVTRAQMAVFLERGMHGADYGPPPAVGIFADVPPSSPFAPWIEQLFHDGVTGGCGGSNYCPGAAVTRAQMAVFLVKARHPSTCAYIASGTIFADVPADHWAAGFIEQLSRERVTGGCGGGLFCPAASVRRDQMAAFLVRGFRLP